MFKLHRPMLGLLTLVVGTVLTVTPPLASDRAEASTTTTTTTTAPDCGPARALPTDLDDPVLEALIDARLWAESLAENPDVPELREGQAPGLAEADALIAQLRQRMRSFQDELTLHGPALGIDVTGTRSIRGRDGAPIDLPLHDFQLPSWEQFVADENALIEHFTEGKAHDLHSLVALYPSPADALASPEFNELLIVTKLIAALGLTHIKGAMKNAFGELIGTEVIWLASDLRAGRHGQAKIILKRILRKITSKRAVRILAKHVGKRIAGRVIAELIAKQLPIIGWAYFLGHALIGLASQYHLI